MIFRVPFHPEQTHHNHTHTEKCHIERYCAAGTLPFYILIQLICLNSKVGAIFKLQTRFVDVKSELINII